jgi:hypothetical protein
MSGGGEPRVTPPASGGGRLRRRAFLAGAAALPFAARAAAQEAAPPLPRPGAAAAGAAEGAGTAAGWRILPVLGREEVEAFIEEGVPSGDFGQYMLGFAQSEAEPDRIYTCQDSGGVWVSLDHGASWNNLRNRGLYARFTTGMAVDPLDPNRVFVLTQGGGREAEAHIGLSRSLDGGLTWERVIANDTSPGRSTQSPVNFAPSSKDPSLGYATRWYCIIQKDSRRRENGLPHELHLSDDGGASWALVRRLASAEFGSITHLAVDPLDPDRVYVYSGEGLWRLEAAAEPEGPITRLSGTGGLPEGGVGDRLHLSPDGRTLIAGVIQTGIFRSDDGGARWTEVQADPALRKLHVNPWDPSRMIVSYAKGKQMRYSTDGGASFAEPASVSTGPGGDRDGLIHEGSCLVVWHPANPDRVWAHGGPRHWQSDNGGRDWRPANGYFNGKQHQNWFVDQMFDPVDPGRFAYFMTDFGVGLTRNGGLWFERGPMYAQRRGLKHSTVNGGAIHPDPSKGIILASVGKMNAGTLLLSRDDGANWEIGSAGDERRQYVGFDLDDPRFAYQWRERSSDDGVTWSAMKALPQGFAVSGMTLVAPGLAQGQAVFAIDRDRGGSNSRILRSLDRGESWDLVVASPYDFGIAGMTGGGPCRAHPSDPDVFFTKGPGETTIRRWQFGGGRLTYVDFNVMGGFPGGRAPDGRFSVMSLAIDRRFPDVMYVVSPYDNGPYKFFRTVDGGASWENLTEGFPGVFLRGLEVSPVTGEVFVGSPNGSRVLPPPYAAPAAFAAGRAAAAAGAADVSGGVWGHRFLDAAY